MSKKIDRALHGPSWSEVILGAVLSLVLGGTIAVVYLIIKPVEVVREMPKEPVKGAVYYLEGSKDSSRGREWLAKRRQFVAGQSVTVTEEELNTAFASIAGDKSKPKAGPPAKDAAPASNPVMSPGAANFRIRNGKLQIGVPVTFNILGLTRDVPVFASGKFEKKGDHFVFEPETYHIGSLAAERLPVLPNFMTGRILAAQPVPEDIATAWTKLSGVAVEDRTLRLSMP